MAGWASRNAARVSPHWNTQIDERPFISVLVAFGIGVVIGKLINR